MTEAAAQPAGTTGAAASVGGPIEEGAPPQDASGQHVESRVGFISGWWDKTSRDWREWLVRVLGMHAFSDQDLIHKHPSFRQHST